jgi:eukaryotic-like serine/threonine-protein kinase
VATNTRLGQLLRRWRERGRLGAEAQQCLANEIISELLLAYEERLAQKQPISSEEMCRECPELISDFQKQRARLDRMNDLLGHPSTHPPPEAAPQNRPGYRPNTVPPLSPLQRLGQYELLTLIGKGGMATVYKARHMQTGQIVAVKVMPPEYNRNPVFLKRFEQEFNASRRINHPHVVRGIEYCGGDIPFIVMEFVDGESLGDRIDNQGPVSEPEAVRLMVQICLALHRAHQLGLIHRDVKPDNILLRRDGLAKLTDLGLVKDTNAEMALTRPGTGFGTLHFMAPEQHFNANQVDHRCDIFSLGATLYMMVTGEPPFGREFVPMTLLENKRNNRITPPRLLVPELSVHMDWAIRRAMQADPARRPSNCREFLEDLTGQSNRYLAERTEDRWYLRFRDAQGNECLARHSTETARQSIQARTLGDPAKVEISAAAEGPFEPLSKVAEFRDLVKEPSSKSKGQAK